MTQHSDTQSLRKDAERILHNLHPPRSAAASHSDLTKIVHELQVHQIELEMQNEQLRKTQTELEQSRELYDFSPVGHITLDLKGKIKEINLAAIKLLVSDRTQLMGSNFTHLIAIEARDRWYLFCQAMLDQNHLNIDQIDIDILCVDHSSFNAHIDCKYQLTSVGIAVLQLIFIDNDQLKMTEREKNIAAIAFESQEGMFITDAEATIIKTNKAFTQISGYEADEVIGHNPRMFSSGKHDEQFYSKMWQTINSTDSWQGEIWNKRKNGEIYPEQLTITAVKNIYGRVTNYVGALTDITQSKQTEQEVENLAYYDPLTCLPNRRLMLDRIHHAIRVSVRTGYEGALLFLDLDHFKNLNDSLGHDIGDVLLQQVAQRLTESVRDGDTVSRFGGDEFVVLLEGLSMQADEAAAQAEEIANKILSSINDSYLLKAHHYTCSTSIGITLFKNLQANAEELLKQADIAMYQAKSDGRNALRFFDPQMQAAIQSRSKLERELNQAIKEQQFEVYYQMQVDHSQHLLGAEALIRWHHPTQGLISPSAFIPLAEQNGTILVIGQWMLDTVCAQLKVWQQDAKTRDLTLSVNVSAKQFHQHNFVSQVMTIISRHDINAQRLKIELTESVLLNDIEETIDKMDALADLGIQFSLDDFGTGYSSLQYLKKLPLHQLKIDQSFIRDLATDNYDQAIVQTILAMAHSLGLSVIAEGVETEEQQQRLAKDGCLYFQGYLYNKPVPIEALIST